MQATIDHWIRINKDSVIKDNSPLLSFNAPSSPEHIYDAFRFSYPKFFKMDLLCKWAWLGAETLLQQDNVAAYEGIDKTKTGVVMATSHGCLEVDKKYFETTATIPSPALFVYTLPNIMLGEICIRHGFKGEQACFVNDHFDAEQLHFWVNDLVQNRGMEACLCGWVDVTADNYELSLFWITRSGKGIPFDIDILQPFSKR